MHIFPQLRKLEKKYQKELAVIGVHSAKFPAEQETRNLRMAILRYEIEHPVINDREFKVWQSYACRAWPTIMIIDPKGRVLGKHEGEISYNTFDRLLSAMIKEYDSSGLIDPEPLGYKRESMDSSPLSFPGNVLADEESGHLFIADSNHNRILQTTPDGDIIDIIGGVTAGFQDGDFVLAAFDHPQGIALDNDMLYVADTENHAIRKVDLTQRYVETLAGTGEQAPFKTDAATPKDSPLNSPWDLVVYRSILYITMAGSHQIWFLDQSNSLMGPFAGTGQENLVDGPLLSANLAQPSGITSNEEMLYFTDSETSSIRMANLDSHGLLRTIVGQGLFEFGDVDGLGDQVRLQHPLGICWHDGTLYVADTYNHKIKKICPSTQTTVTFLGAGTPGDQDGDVSAATFYEPAGLSISNGLLYIADTNNHAIRIADLESGYVTTLDIKGL